MDNTKDETRGRCATCCFLALRPDPTKDRRELIEVSADQRSTGAVYSLEIAGQGGKIPVEPMCARAVANLSDEIHFPPIDLRHGHGPHWNNAVIAFSKDRNCSKWGRYTPGISPTMQVQFVMFEHLEENRKKWEERLEDNRHKWEMELEKDRREWETKNGKGIFWLTVMATFAGLAQVAVAIIALYLSLRQVTPNATP